MTPCSECHAPVGKYELFPQNRCLDCHAKWFDSQPMPTAREIRRMWGMD